MTTFREVVTSKLIVQSTSLTPLKVNDAAVVIGGTLKAGEVIVPINGKEESVGTTLSVLINLLISKGIITKEELDEGLDAIKVADILSDK